MFMKQAAITDQVKMELRNRCMGTIGSAARRSTHTKITRNTAPKASIATTAGSSQPIVPPKLIPSSVEVTPIVMVEIPA